MGSDPVRDVASDIQVPVLHGGKVAMRVHSRADPLLNGFAYRPILPVHQIPEIHRIRRVEAGLVDLMGFEQDNDR